MVDMTEASTGTKRGTSPPTISVSSPAPATAAPTAAKATPVTTGFSANGGEQQQQKEGGTEGKPVDDKYVGIYTAFDDDEEDAYDDDYFIGYELPSSSPSSSSPPSSPASNASSAASSSSFKPGLISFTACMSPQIRTLLSVYLVLDKAKVVAEEETAQPPASISMTSNSDMQNGETRGPDDDESNHQYNDGAGAGAEGVASGTDKDKSGTKPDQGVKDVEGPVSSATTTYESDDDEEDVEIVVIPQLHLVRELALVSKSKEKEEKTTTGQDDDDDDELDYANVIQLLESMELQTGDILLSVNQYECCDYSLEVIQELIMTMENDTIFTLMFRTQSNAISSTTGSIVFDEANGIMYNQSKKNKKDDTNEFSINMSSFSTPWIKRAIVLEPYKILKSQQRRHQHHLAQKEKEIAVVAGEGGSPLSSSNVVNHDEKKDPKDETSPNNFDGGASVTTITFNGDASTRSIGIVNYDDDDDDDSIKNDKMPSSMNARLHLEFTRRFVETRKVESSSPSKTVVTAEQVQQNDETKAAEVGDEDDVEKKRSNEDKGKKKESEKNGSEMELCIAATPLFCPCFAASCLQEQDVILSINEHTSSANDKNGKTVNWRQCNDDGDDDDEQKQKPSRQQRRHDDFPKSVLSMVHTMMRKDQYLSFLVVVPPSIRRRIRREEAILAAEAKAAANAAGGGDEDGLPRWRRRVRKGAVAVSGGAMVGVGAVLMATPLHPIGHAMAFGGVGLLGTEFERPKRAMSSISTSLRNSISSGKRMLEQRRRMRQQQQSQSPQQQNQQQRQGPGLFRRFNSTPSILGVGSSSTTTANASPQEQQQQSQQQDQNHQSTRKDKNNRLTTPGRVLIGSMGKIGFGIGNTNNGNNNKNNSNTDTTNINIATGQDHDDDNDHQ